MNPDDECEEWSYKPDDDKEFKARLDYWTNRFRENENPLDFPEITEVPMTDQIGPNDWLDWQVDNAEDMGWLSKQLMEVEQ